MEVPAGFAIACETPARSRRTGKQLSNYQRAHQTFDIIPVLDHPDFADSDCGDDVSTIHGDKNDNGQDGSVDADSVSCNGPRSPKTASRNLGCTCQCLWQQTN